MLVVFASRFWTHTSTFIWLAITDSILSTTWLYRFCATEIHPSLVEPLLCSKIPNICHSELSSPLTKLTFLSVSHASSNLKASSNSALKTACVSFMKAWSIYFLSFFVVSFSRLLLTDYLFLYDRHGCFQADVLSLSLHGFTKWIVQLCYPRFAFFYFAIH